MNKIKIYSIYILICAVFVSVLINSSYAQSVENFKNYTNNDLNFTIQYPADWKVEETDWTDDHGAEVEFTSPVAASDTLLEPSFTVRVGDVPSDTQSQLDTDTMTLKNITTITNPKQYAQRQLGVAEWSDEITGGTTYKQIRSHEFPVDGKLGWKIEYILGNYYHLRVFTFVNDKVYSLWHRDYTLDAPKTFPIANKMVESFQIKTE